MKKKSLTEKIDDSTFDALPDDAQSNLYKGAHVRQYTSKLRTKVSGPSGEILYFVCPVLKGAKVWRAFVAWRPKKAEHYDQFVDIELLRLENTPPPKRKSFDVTDPDLDAPDGTVVDGMKRVGDQWHPTDETEDDRDLTAVRIKMAEEWIHKLEDESGKPIKIDASELAGLLNRYGKELLRFTKTPRYCPDCSSALQFDANLVGETCGGNSLRGWDVCTNKLCAKMWISEMAVPSEGEWKLASGGRSIETGEGRIRVDGGDNVEKLMARILRLPGLELEVERLRARIENPPPKKDGLGEPLTEAFRALQHRVYDTLIALEHGELGWSGTVKEARKILDNASFENVNSHEVTAAIQYAIKYGRMP